MVGDAMILSIKNHDIDLFNHDNSVPARYGLRKFMAIHMLSWSLPLPLLRGWMTRIPYHKRKVNALDTWNITTLLFVINISNKTTQYFESKQYLYLFISLHGTSKSPSPYVHAGVHSWEIMCSISNIKTSTISGLKPTTKIISSDVQDMSSRVKTIPRPSHFHNGISCTDKHHICNGAVPWINLIQVCLGQLLMI